VSPTIEIATAVKYWQWRCYAHGRPPRYHEFESDAGVCDLCGKSGRPQVQPIVLIHWQRADEKGPLTGQDGRRYSIGCEPKREYLALSRLPQHHYAATPLLQKVTCPSCRGLPLFQQMWKALRNLVHPGMRIVDGPGCCD
jgi:hypothetical protein